MLFGLVGTPSRGRGLGQDDERQRLDTASRLMIGRSGSRGLEVSGAPSCLSQVCEPGRPDAAGGGQRLELSTSDQERPDTQVESGELLRPDREDR